MPMRDRSLNSCSSGIALTSSPKTKMRPESGRNKPSANFSSTLLPTPAGPRRIRVSPCLTVKEMLLRTCLFSKPIETSSKTTAGSSGERCSGSVTIAVWLMYALPPEDADHKTADDEIGSNDENGGPDYGLRSRAAHALRASARGHAVIAADTGDDEAEDQRLNQALQDIGIAK